MRKLLRSIFTVKHTYPNPIDQQRAQALIIIVLALNTLVVGAALFDIIPGLFNGELILSITVIFAVVLTLAGAIIRVAVHRGYLRPASYGLVYISLALVTVAVLFNEINLSAYTALLVPLVMAGLLLGWRNLLFVAAIISVALVQNMVTTAPVMNDMGVNLVFREYSITIAFILAITGILVLFGYNIQALASGFLSNVSGMRRSGQKLALFDERLTIPERIRIAVDGLVSDFGYTFAQVYLVNEAEEPTGRIYSGMITSGGTQMIDVGNMDKRSGVMEVIRTIRPMTLTLTNEAIEREHFLPGILSGVLIPMVHRNSIIGVIDVQSESKSSFTAEDMANIQYMSGQLVSSIAIARTIDDLRGTLAQQEALVAAQSDRLRQIERSQREAIIDRWSTFMAQRGISMMGYDIDRQTISEAMSDELPERLEEAIETGELVVTSDDHAHHVSVPILLNGEPLGALDFDLPANRPLTGRQAEMLRNIAQRLALAMENQRLFEQSQAQADRKSLANTIASELLTRTQIDDLLELAANNFNEAVGAVQTRIHIDPTSASQAQASEEVR